MYIFLKGYWENLNQKQHIRSYPRRGFVGALWALF